MKKIYLLIAIVVILALANPVFAGKPEPNGVPLELGNDTFPAETAFHIKHGWLYETHPDLSHKYELEWNGEIQKNDIFDIQKDPDTGAWTWVWIYNFPDGLTGTHTFVHRWYARCGEVFEDCDNNGIMEVHQVTQTVYFVSPCTDSWTSTFTDKEKSYVFEIFPFPISYATRITTENDLVDPFMEVNVTSLTSGNTWSFSDGCHSTGCGYLLGWYPGTAWPIEEGPGLYQVEITQDQEGLVTLYCLD